MSPESEAALIAAVRGVSAAVDSRLDAIDTAVDCLRKAAAYYQDHGPHLEGYDRDLWADAGEVRGAEHRYQLEQIADRLSVLATKETRDEARWVLAQARTAVLHVAVVIQRDTIADDVVFAGEDEEAAQ